MTLTHEYWETIAQKNQRLARLAETGDLGGLRRAIETEGGSWHVSAEVGTPFNFYLRHCAAAWHQWCPNEIQEFRELFNRVEPQPHSILDLGFGYGHILLDLMQTAQATDPSIIRRLVGVDLAPQAKEKLQQQINEASFIPVVTPELHTANACTVRLDEKFDLVLAMQIIEHLSPQQGQALLKTAWAHTPPSGTLILSTRLNENLGHALVQCPGCEHVFHPAGHVRSFSEVLLRAELLIAGWWVVHTHITPGVIRVLCRKLQS